MNRVRTMLIVVYNASDLVQTSSAIHSAWHGLLAHSPYGTTPRTEDGMGGLQHADIDVVVGLRQRGD